MNFEKFSALTQQIIASAQKKAESRSHAAIEPAHLLVALLEDSGNPVSQSLRDMGHLGSVKVLADKALQKLPTVSGSSAGQSLSNEGAKVFQSAEKWSQKMGDTVVTVEHLFLGILESASSLSPEFSKLGINTASAEIALRKIRGSHKADDPQAEQKYQALEKYSKDLTKLASDGKLDPVIGRDEEIRRVIQVLSRRTKNNPVLIGEPGVGKTAIAEGLAQRIIKGDVPETLKGKSIRSLDLGAMVAGAKFRGEFEERLKAFLQEVQDSAGQIVLFIDELHTLIGAGKSDGAMDAGNLLKPALARGELRCVGATTLDEYRKYIEKDPALERRFQQVYVGEPSVEDTVSILRGLKEKYEVHHGVRIQDQALIAAAMLSSRYIADRFLPDKAIDLIDEAAAKLRIEIDSMPSEIDKKVRFITQLEVEKEALKKEKDAASQSRLRDIDLIITEEKGSVDILKSQWQKEKDEISRIRLLQEEIEQLAIELERSERQGELQKAAEIKYGRIPAKQKALETAQSLLRETAKDKRMLKEEVEAEDVASIVGKWTGIPVEKLMQGENQKLLSLEDILKKRVRGQDQSLDAVANAVRLARSGLKDPNKPIGSFMFLGPTGVGKTETAKALAEFLFDSEQNMIRIDMSEYMEKHSVARLIGAPPGYVGYDEGGQLTEAVRRRPYSVILFDEIEKAHPDVLNVLLQVLDDGRLTDGQGRIVDFKNSVLIMTSNIGSHLALENPDQEVSVLQTKMLEELKAHLRPEFINRIDEIIVYKPLTNDLIREIVDVQLRQFDKILKEKKITLNLSDAAKDYLAKVGYDPLFGARPLKRALYKYLQVPLSKKILSGDYADGERLKVDYKGGDTLLLEKDFVN
ncbi:MAG: ATP-dependent chaperone ClpB [Proteobacteria bacterium]|nr:ATP-dependent chaperone ClpB [Pseudomonadota bacterium]